MTLEEKRIYARKWRELNRDKINAQRREKYKLNSEKQKEYNKKWNEKNKEKVRESKHNYYLKNKDKIEAMNKKWRKENKKRWIQLLSGCRKRRVERLRSEGIINAWGVVNKGEEPKHLEQ